jgi:transposase
MLKNQLHAEEVEAHPSKMTISRIKSRIRLINTQIRATQTETAAIIRNDAEINRGVTLVTSIPGIGIVTAAVIMAETNGFALIRSKKQLTSYAGLDVKEKESGTSVKGKSRISKRGNRYLRKAMYMPALAAIRHSERYKAIFVRIVSRNGIKMKGCVAVQRKLLEMAYTIYKTNTSYQANYLQTRQENELVLNN